ncbi:MAG: hypothetical protein K2G52_00235, partial [Muribaculaceae bacterium]|nr:hypothetical protein [Muribaculaceae bacterium]
MKKIIVYFMFTLGYLSCNAQIFDMLNSDLYHGRVKLVSEFMQRFNGEEKNPYIAPEFTDVEKINLCQLFDIESIIKNRPEVEPKAFQFIDSVIQNNVKIHYSDAEWYAKVKCTGAFKGKEVTFQMYLTVEPRGEDMYKWVIADVDGKIFNLSPSRESDKIMLLPNEHESNFMRLNSITSEKDDYITLYTSKCQNVNRLTVFNTLVYYGYLNIDYVTDIEYTFLQVPGYTFTIKEYERESTNSGWLIKDWNEISNVEKESTLQRLYNGNYSTRVSSKSENVPSNSAPKIESTAAVEKVTQFVKYLNDYITNKSSVSEINNAVKGRYTFIISDELCNQLTKYYKTKSQKSYRLETLLGWLGKTNSPIKSIQVLNPELFVNEN